MIFSSFEFLFVFLPIVLVLFHVSRVFLPFRVATTILILASIVFYAYWKPSFVFVILLSIAFNFFVGRAIVDQKVKDKKLVVFGVVANLLYLGYFKYTGFLVTNLNGLISSDLNIPKIILPLGISFFTFQQITYLVDSYSKKLGRVNFIDYCLFVTFFPQLIAGPIVHHKEMMPQFETIGKTKISSSKLSLGAFIFSVGLAQKVLIADQLSTSVNLGFGSTEVLAIHEAWLSSLGYTFQLYFDFAGYANMAIGVALLFGIRLPVNFNSPYKARSIQDFWRRWHITLSRFLRDYIYIPLGGNKVQASRQYLNLFLTFLIGGIWHGAGWTFFVWGAAHGFATMVHRFWGRVIKIKLPFLLSWAITFGFVLIAWIFFRAPDFVTATNMVKSLFDISSAKPFLSAFKESSLTLDLAAVFPVTQPKLMTLVILFLAAVIAFFAPSTALLARKFKGSVWLSIFTISIFILSLANMENVSEFLYFDF